MPLEILHRAAPCRNLPVTSAVRPYDTTLDNLPFSFAGAKRLRYLARFVAYQQWRIAQNKLKHDLFDRRLVVYEAARDYISSVMASGKSTQKTELEFLAGTRGAKWLFDEEVTQYLDKELWHKICGLGCLQSELDGMPAGEERTSKSQAQVDRKKWRFAQMRVLDEKFAPFLRLPPLGPNNSIKPTPLRGAA